MKFGSKKLLLVGIGTCFLMGAAVEKPEPGHMTATDPNIDQLIESSSKPLDFSVVKHFEACSKVHTGCKGDKGCERKIDNPYNYTKFLASMFVKNLCEPSSLLITGQTEYEIPTKKDAVARFYTDKIAEDPTESMIGAFSILHTHIIRESNGDPLARPDFMRKDENGDTVHLTENAPLTDADLKKKTMPERERGIFHTSSNSLDSHIESGRIFSEYIQRMADLADKKDRQVLSKDEALKSFDTICGSSSFRDAYLNPSRWEKNETGALVLKSDLKDEKEFGMQTVATFSDPKEASEEDLLETLFNSVTNVLKSNPSCVEKAESMGNVYRKAYQDVLASHLLDDSNSQEGIYRETDHEKISYAELKKTMNEYPFQYARIQKQKEDLDASYTPRDIENQVDKASLEDTQEIMRKLEKKEKAILQRLHGGLNGFAGIVESDTSEAQYQAAYNSMIEEGKRLGSHTGMHQSFIETLVMQAKEVQFEVAKRSFLTTPQIKKINIDAGIAKNLSDNFSVLKAGDGEIHKSIADYFQNALSASANKFEKDPSSDRGSIPPYLSSPEFDQLQPQLSKQEAVFEAYKTKAAELAYHENGIKNLTQRISELEEYIREATKKIETAGKWLSKKNISPSVKKFQENELVAQSANIESYARQLAEAKANLEFQNKKSPEIRNAAQVAKQDYERETNLVHQEILKINLKTLASTEDAHKNLKIKTGVYLKDNSSLADLQKRIQVVSSEMDALEKRGKDYERFWAATKNEREKVKELDKDLRDLRVTQRLRGKVYYEMVRKARDEYLRNVALWKKSGEDSAFAKSGGYWNSSNSSTAACYSTLQRFCPRFSVDSQTIVMRVNRAHSGPYADDSKMEPECDSFYRELASKKSTYCATRSF